MQRRAFQAAHARFAEALEINAELSYKHGVAMDLEGMADLAASQHQYERALRLGGAAAALRQAAGMIGPVEFRTHHQRKMAEARSALEPSVAEANWTEGGSLTLQGIIGEALAAVD